MCILSNGAPLLSMMLPWGRRVRAAELGWGWTGQLWKTRHEADIPPYLVTGEPRHGAEICSLWAPGPMDMLSLFWERWLGPGSDFCLRSQTTIPPGLLAADACRAPELPASIQLPASGRCCSSFPRIHKADTGIRGENSPPHPVEPGQTGKEIWTRH